VEQIDSLSEVRNEIDTYIHWPKKIQTRLDYQFMYIFNKQWIVFIYICTVLLSSHKAALSNSPLVYLSQLSDISKRPL
jgi:hypothetical protein